LIGALAVKEPILAIGVAVASLLAFLCMLNPDVPTLAVVFILYTNAAVVFVNYHGLPFIAGAALPILLVVPLIYYLIIRREKIVFHSVLLLFLLFLSVQLIGTVRAIQLDVALSEVITFAVEGLALYFLITNVIRTPRTLRRVIWILLVAGAFLGALSFFQQITHSFDSNFGGFAQLSNASFGTGTESLQGEIEQPRLAGPFGDQNYYAQFMLMLVPIGLFQSWSEKAKTLRILALIATGLILIGAALTFSRGAAVGFVLMLVLTALMRYIKFSQLAIVALALLLVFQLFPQYGTRLSTLSVVPDLLGGDIGAGIGEADSSTKSRLTEMGAAALVFVDHPIAGVGPGMFKYYYIDYAEAIGYKVHATVRAAHDLYLDIAADSGSLGLFSFLGIVFMTLRNLTLARRRWRNDKPELAMIATGLMLSIFTFLATGIFLSFAYERYFWLIIALGGVTSYLASDNPQVENARN
jgi:putative inorganic carbon (HCO3(-)) transporter